MTDDHHPSPSADGADDTGHPKAGDGAGAKPTTAHADGGHASPGRAGDEDDGPHPEADDTPTHARVRWGPRVVLERFGLGLTGLLGVVVLGFVLLNSLQELPVLGTAYETFLIGGAWMDYFLGTNVFRHPFMWHSLATGVLVGVVAPLVGTFVVHREMALIGETLAHTAFAGIAVGLVLVGLLGYEGPLLFVALVVAILGALGVQWLADRTTTYGDVPIAIVLSGSFAIGTLLISYGRGQFAVAIDVESYLFGSISVVTAGGARTMATISLVVLAAVLWAYKPLVFITFDQQAARVAQLPVDRYNTLLIVLTAIVVVGAIQILGVILVAAMLVVPVAAASQLANSFRETVVLSVLFGEAAVLVGFAVSIAAGLPSGGSIVVVAIAWYLLAVLVSERSPRSVSTY